MGRLLNAVRRTRARFRLDPREVASDGPPLTDGLRWEQKGSGRFGYFVLTGPRRALKAHGREFDASAFGKRYRRARHADRPQRRARRRERSARRSMQRSRSRSRSPGRLADDEPDLAAISAPQGAS